MRTGLTRAKLISSDDQSTLEFNPTGLRSQRWPDHRTPSFVGAGPEI